MNQATLFPDEEPPDSARTPRAHRPQGLVSIRQLARDLKGRGRKVNARTLKRRLKDLHEKLEGQLLVQFKEGGHYLVRLDILRRELPELVTPQVDHGGEDEDSSEYSQASGVAHQLREMRGEIAKLSEEVRALRDVVVGGYELATTISHV